MDVDEALRAADPAMSPSAEISTQIALMAAEAETFVAGRPRSRAAALVGGALAVVFVGAGVAHATGVSVPGIHSNDSGAPVVDPVATLRTDPGMAALGHKLTAGGARLLAEEYARTCHLKAPALISVQGNMRFLLTRVATADASPTPSADESSFPPCPKP